MMLKVEELKKQLARGKVYRRADLAKLSRSVDRHLEELTRDGTLRKLSHGMYFYPKKSVFGEVPPEEKVLLRSFLNDERFLLTSPNAYNSLGVGTTQLYNTRVVYNRKRHGNFKLGNRVFNFQYKSHFPNQVTTEFLLVDLVNNLENLAEDKQEVLTNVLAKAKSMNSAKLRQSVKAYGNARTKKLFVPVLDNISSSQTNK